MSLARNIGDLPNGDDAPLFGCRAWVNFQGSNAFSPNPSTLAIRKSGNVSSITDRGTGEFTVTFTNAMPDTDYSVVTSATRGTAGVEPAIAGPAPGSVLTTSGVAISVKTDAGSADDSDMCCVAVFR